MLQGLPPGAADPRYAKVGERGQSSGADPLGRPDHDAQSDVQLECDLTDYIGRMPDQSVALDRALDTHVRQAGLVPKAVSLRQWLMHRPAVFEVKGQMVSLTQQSVEYDRHLEAQFISFLQQIARPAHLSKDIGQYCKKHNIEMRVRSQCAILHIFLLHLMLHYMLFYLQPWRKPATKGLWDWFLT